jgi:putative ubiquitin-RnfH superfamily antitoxin RatB of RatAB toxin-antitoxin module
MASDRTEDAVTVVYALPDEQHIVSVDYTEGLTASQAVERSGLAQRFPEINSNALVLGVYGQAVTPEKLLAPGMRVEICRALQRDPRELRRMMSSQGMVVGQREPDDN